MNNEQGNKAQIQGQPQTQPQKQDEKNVPVDQTNPQQSNSKKVVNQVIFQDIKKQQSTPQTQQNQKINQNPDNKVIKRQDEKNQQEASDIGDQSRKQPCIDVIQEIKQLNQQVLNKKDKMNTYNYYFKVYQHNRPTKRQQLNSSNQDSSIENYQNYYQPSSQLQFPGQSQYYNNPQSQDKSFLKQKQEISQSNFCKISGHQQKSIEFVCIYPECTLNRFVCSKCLKVGNHKHQQQDQSHILDNKELYSLLKEKMKSRQSEQSRKIIEKYAKLKNEMHKMIKLLRNMIDVMDLGIEQYLNVNQLNESLIRFKNEGFNTLDEWQLKILINIDKPVDFNYAQIQKQSNHLIQNTTKIQQLCQSFKLFTQ
ncbi:hypothetical protein pb186bvf_015279 [Paramecium bursaria]